MDKQKGFTRWKKEINTLSEYIDSIARIHETWNVLTGENIFPWFRGHSNHTYNLIPGIYRKSFNRDGEELSEDDYRHDFVLKAPPFLSDVFVFPKNDWDWYFIMQHYGIPTRLLDWSEGALTPLYFALSEYKRDSGAQPCVWVLNPFALNEHVAKRGDYILHHPNEMKDYLHKVWSDKSLAKKPIAIQPSFNSRRIASQKGGFVLFGSEKKALEDIPALKPHLYRVDIDPDWVDNLSDELIMCGITDSLVYPELSGLSKEIIRYYR